MGLDPRLQAGPIENPGSDLKNGLLGLVYRRLKPTAIAPKKRMAACPTRLLPSTNG